MSASDTPTPLIERLRALRDDCYCGGLVDEHATMYDAVERIESLEDQLTAAKLGAEGMAEAIRRVDPGQEFYADGDPYPWAGAAVCEISYGDLIALREALTAYEAAKQ